MNRCLLLLTALSPILLIACATAPRDIFPVQGTHRLDPPPIAAGLTVERVDMSLAPLATDPHRRRLLRDLAIELSVPGGGQLRAADFQLVRETLAAVELSADDDLTPYRATGLAEGPGGEPRAELAVPGDGRIWLIFRGVQLRALNAAGGHPVPLRITLRRADGSRWPIVQPAIGQPVWRSEPWPIFARSAISTALALGRRPDRTPAAPYGGARGGGGFAGSYEVGVGGRWRDGLVWAHGDAMFGARDAFVEDGVDPRISSVTSTQFGVALMLGWVFESPLANGTHSRLRIGAGWRVAWVVEGSAVTDDVASPATIHGLPLELGWAFDLPHPTAAPLVEQPTASAGFFLRLTPRLGVLDGDDRFGDGLDYVFGLEISR